MKENLLSIVVPAYNEEGAIEQVLEELVEAFPKQQIIVVDDKSEDNTRETIIQLSKKYSKIKYVFHRYNCGYGAALKTGMQHASGKYIAWFDADGEHQAKDLAAMVDLISSRPLAAVIGQRLRHKNTVLRFLGKKVIWALCYLLKFRRCSDLNCGLRVFDRETILPYITLLPERYSASLTTTMLLFEMGYPTELYPITTKKRIGKSKVKIKDGWKALTKVLQLIMLFAPMRIFFRVGMFFISIGTLYSVYIALMKGFGVPVAGLLVFISGILLAMLGLIADQISHFRLAQIKPLPSIDSDES